MSRLTIRFWAAKKPSERRLFNKQAERTPDVGTVSGPKKFRTRLIEKNAASWFENYRHNNKDTNENLFSLTIDTGHREFTVPSSSPPPMQVEGEQEEIHGKHRFWNCWKLLDLFQGGKTWFVSQARKERTWQKEIRCFCLFFSVGLQELYECANFNFFSDMIHQIRN